MLICQGFEEFAPFRGAVVAIGNFDGVHLGHRAMIAALLRTARARKVPAVAFTFDPHPIAVLRGSPPPALTTTARKLNLLSDCGVDCTFVYPTDSALLEMSPVEFFEQVLLAHIQVIGVVEGANFRFGNNRAGDVALLEQLCQRASVSCEIVAPVLVGDRVVSSSEIRSQVLRGAVKQARCMLGSSYRITGRVMEGARRGRTIGFPTANLAEIATVVPPEGVYAGRAWVEGRAYPAGINIGPNPTFAETQQKFEVHLLDFDGDLYGQRLDVDLLDRLRDTRPFHGPAELIAQLHLDMQQVRIVFTPLPTPSPTHS